MKDDRLAAGGRRPLRAGEARRARLAAGVAGRPADAAAPRDLRPDRPAADAGGDRGVPRRTSRRTPSAKVVDRLLASPAYGERWGRHWLDVVRYADTAGDNSDYPIPQMYRYRNWVIDAFNRDMPYDQFVREQLAGDLLPSDGRSRSGTAS